MQKFLSFRKIASLCSRNFLGAHDLHRAEKIFFLEALSYQNELQKKCIHKCSRFFVPRTTKIFTATGWSAPELMYFSSGKEKYDEKGRKKMNFTYPTIYIGYYMFNNSPILLCVSEDKYPVKYYLQEIRKLSNEEYDIKVTLMDHDSILSFYGDYLLYPFNDEILYLTERDINFINREIDWELERLQTLLEGLDHYSQLISNSRKLYTPIFKQASNTLEEHLSNVKSIRRISKEVIRESPILSPNIREYFQYMGMLEESKNMIDKFYMRVDEE